MEHIKHSDKQKLKILNAGLKLWRAGERLTLRAVADAVGVTHGAISYHFKEDGLFDAVAAHAVEKGYSRMVAYLVIQNHPSVKGMSSEDRKRHIDAVIYHG